MRIKINKDISKYKPVLFGSITKRQFLTGIADLIVLILIIAITKNRYPITITAFIILILEIPTSLFIMEELPFFLLPFEKVIPIVIQYFRTPERSKINEQPKDYNMFNRNKYSTPRSVQDFIPIDTFYNDGIAVTNGYYSCVYRVNNIDFTILTDKDKELLLSQLEDFIASIPDEATYKISIRKHVIDKKEFFEDFMFDGFEINPNLSSSMNKLLYDEINFRNQISHDILITVTTHSKSYKDAVIFFNETDNQIIFKLNEMEASCHRLDFEERVKLYQEMYRFENDNYLPFKDISSLNGNDIRKYCCPEKWKKYDDYLVIGDKYVRTMFLSAIASTVPDKMFASFTDTSEQSISVTSIEIKPMTAEESERAINVTLASTRGKISEYKQSKAKKYEIATEAPPTMEKESKACKEVYDDYYNRDQRLHQCTITVCLYADSLEELNHQTKAVKEKAKSDACRFDTLYYQQIQGLFSCLPFGPVNILQNKMMFTTESIAAFVPFTTQVVQNTGVKSTWIGSNPISQNVNTINRSNLFNGNGLIFGTSGSGKSVQTKLEIIQRRLKEPNNSEIIILDPNGEYTKLVYLLGGTTIDVSVGSQDHINIMEMDRYYGSNMEIERKYDPTKAKISFMQKVFAEIYDDTNEKSFVETLVSRCCTTLYKDYVKHEYSSDYVPTLEKLYYELHKQPEDTAQSMCLALEQYVTGNLNVFSHESNVTYANGIVSFDMSAMDDHFKSFGLLVMLDQVLNRISENYINGKYTYVYIDEFHKFFGSSVEDTMMSLWKMGRKSHCYSTGITQNISDVLKTINGRSIVANSEFMQILKCGDDEEIEEINQVLKLPIPLRKYIVGEKNPNVRLKKSTGLIKYAGTIIPFESCVPEGSYIYSIINTD